MTDIAKIIEIAKTLGWTSPLLSPKDAARFFDKSTEWLELQRRQGCGPAYSKLGPAKNSSVVYSIIDLVEFHEAHRVKTV